MNDDLRYMTPAQRRTILASTLTSELFEHDQGFRFDPSEASEIEWEEYDAWGKYVAKELMPIIAPYLSTGRIVHGDDV